MVEVGSPECFWHCSYPVPCCREDLFAEMMSEREDIASRREACHKMLQALHSAMATLDSLPQTLMSRVSTCTSGSRYVAFVRLRIRIGRGQWRPVVCSSQLALGFAR